MFFNTITVTHNSESIFTLLLDLQNKMASKNMNMLIVVDNHSTEAYLGDLKNMLDVFTEKTGILNNLIKRDKNYLFTDSNNVGIEWSIKYIPEADYLVLINPDISVHPLTVDDPLTAIIDEMIKNKADMGSCKLVFNGGHTHGLLDSAGVIENRHIGYRQKVDSVCNSTTEVSHLDGALMVLSKKIVEKIGLMDAKSYPHWTSDIEYGLRARNFGYKVVCTPVVLYHECGSATLEHHLESQKDLPDGLRPKETPTYYLYVKEVAKKNSDDIKNGFSKRLLLNKGV